MLSKYRDEIMIGILLILIALLIISKCSPSKVVADSRGTADSTLYWKNKYNQEVASHKATAEQFAIQDARTTHILDSIARVYSTSARKIQEYVIATVKGTTTLPPVPGTQERDTVWIPGEDPVCPPRIKNVRETFASSWYTAKVQIGDSSYMHLTTQDSLTVLWKTVKEGKLFNKKRYLQLDVSFADTSRKITSMSSFRRLEKQKEISLNLEADIWYLNKGFHPLAGIGIQRSANRYNAGITVGKALTDIAPGVNVKTLPWYGKASFQFKLIKL